MAFGRIDPQELLQDGDAMTSLDHQIIQIAGKELGGSEKTAFFYAYHCQKSWEDIAELFLRNLGKKVKSDTVRSYGDRAKKNVKLAARSYAPKAPAKPKP